MLGLENCELVLGLEDGKLELGLEGGELEQILYDGALILSEAICEPFLVWTGGFM